MRRPGAGDTKQHASATTLVLFFYEETRHLTLGLGTEEWAAGFRTGIGAGFRAGEEYNPASAFRAETVTAAWRHWGERPSGLMRLLSSFNFRIKVRLACSSLMALTCWGVRPSTSYSTCVASTTEAQSVVAAMYILP